MTGDIKIETAAIEAVLAALEPLQPEDRTNVIEYVFKKLGMAPPVTGWRDAADLGAPNKPSPDKPLLPGNQPQNIRSLKEQKGPKTASQMVALVAYYLEHLAPQTERREFIQANDIREYFKQGGFPYKKAPPAVTLNRAKNAGYLNALGGGKFQLNPVGFNLIAYKLPADGDKAEQRHHVKTTKRKNSKKARK
jgi:hypothetical protein